MGLWPSGLLPRDTRTAGRDAALVAAGAVVGGLAVRAWQASGRAESSATSDEGGHCSDGDTTGRLHGGQAGVPSDGSGHHSAVTIPSDSGHDRQGGAAPPPPGALRLSSSPARVAQSVLEHGRGDALRACVASVFGLALGEVPDLLADPAGYDVGLARFVGAFWAPVKVALPEHGAHSGGGHGGRAAGGAEGSIGDSVGGDDSGPRLPPPGTVVILRGKSPRGPHGHVVVARVKEGGTADAGTGSAASFTGAFDMVADPHPSCAFLDASEPLRWCMHFAPGPDAPVALLAGGAQRVRDTLRTASPWRVVNCDAVSDVRTEDAARAQAMVVSINFKEQLPGALAPGVLPGVSLVQIMSAGYDWLDLDAVPPTMTVCNTSSMDHCIAEYVMAALLHFEVRLIELSRPMREPPGFLFNPPFHRRPASDGSGRLVTAPFRSELKGKTVGVIGFGRIGKQVAARAAAFGVRVVATRSRSPPAGAPPPPPLAWIGGPDAVDALLAESDYVVVACPLSPATTGLIDAGRLGRMKRSAVLVNVARGPVVAEEAVFNALRDGIIRGAALDVWYSYPRGGQDPQGVPPSAHPFHELDTDRVLLTPHSSGWTDGQEKRKAAQIAANLDALADGRPLAFVVRAPTVSA